MLYLFRLLLLLINIDQETVLNWFGMEDPSQIRQVLESGYELNISNFEPSTDVSLIHFVNYRRFMGKNSRWSNIS
jgi:hypothetical protein